jgi:hypothetical protein
MGTRGEDREWQGWVVLGVGHGMWMWMWMETSIIKVMISEVEKR